MHRLDRHFETLDLTPDASLEEVKQAYRDLAQVWHPDRYAHNPRLQSKAEQRLKAINEAYQALTSDPTAFHRTETPQSNARTAPTSGGPSPQARPQATKPTATKRNWGWTIAAFLSAAIIRSCYQANTNERRQYQVNPRWDSPSLPSITSAPVTLDLPPPAYLELGMTEREVRSLLGEPTQQLGNVLYYGNSLIFFRNGIVSGWAENSAWPLKTKKP